MAAGLHISISAETIATIGGIPISNSMVTSLIVSGILILFAVAVRASLKPTSRPSGLQNLAEWMIELLYNLVHSVTGSHKKTRHFFPLVASFFLFILLNNWLGLVPGVGTIGFNEGEKVEHARLLESKVAMSAPQAQAATTAPAADDHGTPTTTEPVLHTENTESKSVEGEHATESDTQAEAAGHGTVFVPYLRAGTADLNTTLALAFISVFMTQVFGVQYLKLSYFKKFINFSSPITFFIGILEMILESAKVVSFAFRLFGNIFAGEVLLAVISFLVPVIAPMPFYGLEVAVGLIQALVFTMLSVVFFNMATTSHDDH